MAPMPTAAAHPSRPRHASRGVPPLLVSAVLLALLLAGVATPRWAVAQDDVPPSDVVPAVTAAYGDVGTVAVVVAHQQERLRDVSIRAAEAASARVLARTAGSELADRPFPTASMVKLFLAEDILHRARTGALTLTADDRAQLEVMIRSSDDPAASDFWVRFDGARMVRNVATRYGLSGTSPPARWGQWGETTTTADDLAWFLVRLPVVAHPDDAAALLGWMGTATPIASDGFEQEFGVFGTLPGPAVKQGWMCCLSGQRHLHSVGVVDSRVVVLLSEVPSSVGWDTAKAALDAAAAAVPPPVGP
jgi:hypothetical protein